MRENRGRTAVYREYDYIYGREARLRRIRIIRRRRAQRRRILRLAAALLVALFLWLILTGFTAAHTERQPVYRYYSAVTVRSGDTLWGIAQQHLSKEYSSVRAYMKDIMEVNDMKTDAVYYGQKIILPYYSTERK